MQSKNTVLEYQGRLPKRAGSLAKRNSILQASLHIVEEEGIRGIRHRAVAEKAGVPLAATTYYFTDIDELILDSFVYFIETNLLTQQSIFDEVLTGLEENKLALKSQAELKNYFQQLLLNYLSAQVEAHQERIVEREFYQYAVRDGGLAKKIYEIQRYFEQQIEKILIQLKIDEPAFKAHMILAFIHLSEEQGLLSRNFDKQLVSQNIQQLLEQIFN